MTEFAVETGTRFYQDKYNQGVAFEGSIYVY